MFVQKFELDMNALNTTSYLALALMAIVAVATKPAGPYGPVFTG
jgi:hypothetical protein